MNQKLFVTDFDGTLATQSGAVSEVNRKALELLGAHGFVRVIATGRNLFSARKVIDPEFPVDYVIFTTGAGLIHWPSQKMLVSHHLNKDLIEEIFHCFIQHQIDFMIHEPIPDNHFFQFFETGLDNSDFEVRKRHYEQFCRSGSAASLPISATQFLGVLRPEQTDALCRELAQTLTAVNVVRATSPFDHKSIWVEVFSKKAAKHLTTEFLIQQLGISRAKTVAIGNDYNDVDLLNWAGKSFAVENAISSLKKTHEIVAHVENDGFAEAVGKVLG